VPHYLPELLNVFVPLEGPVTGSPRFNTYWHMGMDVMIVPE